MPVVVGGRDLDLEVVAVIGRRVSIRDAIGRTGAVLQGANIGRQASPLEGLRGGRRREREVLADRDGRVGGKLDGSASDDACLFGFNDLPVMHSLGLYREEAFGDNQGRQKQAT